MGSSSTLGLLFEISADASKAQAALARFGPQINQLTDVAFVPAWERAGAAAAKAGDLSAAGMRRTGTEVRQATAAAMVLEQQFGVQLPRGINAMLARSSLIGPLLQNAFSIAVLAIFITQIDKVADAIGSAALRLGGFSKEAQKLFKEEIEFNNWLISRSKERLETELKINLEGRAKINAAIARTKTELKTSEEASTAAGKSAVSTYKGMDMAAAGHRAVVSGLRTELARLEGQLGVNEAAGEKYNLELAKLQESHEKHTAKVKESTWEMNKMVAAIHQFGDLEKQLQVQLDAGTVPSLKRYLEANEKINEVARTGLNVYGLRRLNQLIFEKQRTDELREGMEKLFQEMHKHSLELPAIIAGTNQWFSADTRLTAEQRARLPLMKDETTTLARLRMEAEDHAWTLRTSQLPAMRQIEEQYRRERAAAKAALEEMRRDYAERKILLADWERAQADYAAGEQARTEASEAASEAEAVAMADAMVGQVAGLLQTLGLRRAAAIVEAAWETARSIACFASLDWYGGTMHALAAAQYYVVAAKAGGGGGGGGGAGAYSPGGGGGGAAGGGPGGGPPPALAPGAAGGGRFSEGGVTVIFQGPVYGGKAGIHELVTDISQAVERQGARLISTESKGLRGGGG